MLDASTDRQEIEALRYLTLEFSTDGLAEIRGRSRVVFLPREAIVFVELRRGIAGERPIAQLVLGGATLAAALWWLAVLLRWLSGEGGPGLLRGVAAVPFLVGVAGYVLHGALRPTYYLYARTAGDARKLLITGRLDLRAIAAVFRQAHARFGYVIHSAIQLPRAPEGFEGPYR